MKIFSAAQIKQWDAFTIANEPVASIDLMETAAAKVVDWIVLGGVEGKSNVQKHFQIFCGKGNNGGDGAAIARMLVKKNYTVTVYILEFGNTGTADFQTNLLQLRECCNDIHFIQTQDQFPLIKEDALVIDALFGIGLNKPLQGISAALVQHINRFKATVIAIDMPSGLSADGPSKNNAVIKATHTLSFQNHKLAFLLPENDSYCGNIHLLDIGLSKKFEEETAAAFEITDVSFMRSIYKPRNKFSHKGNFGHAALICGSYGMMGAAVLSAAACLRSGAGKLSCYIPKQGYDIVQTSVPEAMCIVSGEEYIVAANGIEKFDAVGIGPGIGSHTTHCDLLKTVFEKFNKPMLIDADALNIIANDKTLLSSIPAGSILSPHPKEFERVFGKTVNETERLQLALERSKAFHIYIIIKGHYSFISTPEGKGFFNATGNAGMATAGSGDVLSGMLTGLLAQGYQPLEACLLGTYLHGLAGDLAAAAFSEEAMIAGDITAHLGPAFKTFSQKL
jgi:hydroxyethylthiazole kinase-like uncharacterized protein yjeF